MDSTPLYMDLKRALHQFSLVGISVVLAACQSLGSRVQQLDVEMSVAISGQSSNGGSVNYERLAPRWPFSSPRYESANSTWVIQTHVDGLGVLVVNHGVSDLELHWDEARWRSSFQEEWVDFLVHHQSVGRLPRQALLEEADRENPFQPQPWSLSPGNKEQFSFQGSLGEGPPNPGGFLFGIAHEDVFDGTFEQGVGNWIELEIPISETEERVILQLRLVLTDAEAWVVYY